jgi:hypothetical protein
MNPVFDVLLRIGKARLDRAQNIKKASKQPRRDELDEKSLALLAPAVWRLERLKNQPELSSNDLVSFGACAAVIGHFAPFSELPLAHRDVSSRAGDASAKLQAPKVASRDASGCTQMEDEKQLVRELFTKPFSGQSLDDAIDAFNDLSGRDRRALTAEFLSSPLGKDFEKVSRQLAHAAEKLAPSFEAVTRSDLKRALLKLIPEAAIELAREKRKRPEILEAIIAVRGNNPVEHTTASAILPKVNALLKSRGYAKPTSKKAVYTRLKKHFPT